MGIPEQRDSGAENLLKETITEFPKTRKELDIEFHEAKRTPNYLKEKDLLQDTY